MGLTEYRVERTEQVLTVRRTTSYMIGSIPGALCPVAAIVWMWRGFPPTDGVSRMMLLAFSVFMAAILYRIIFWGRHLVFDRQRDLFLLDGSRVCALSELSSVQMKAAPGRPASRLFGRFLTLHLRTVSGRDVALKGAWERYSDCAALTHMSHEVAEFVGARGRRA